MRLTTAAVEMEDEDQEWWQDRIQINGHKQNKVRRKTTNSRRFRYKNREYMTSEIN
jgi:hypothetical protein